MARSSCNFERRIERYTLHCISGRCVLDRRMKKELTTSLGADGAYFIAHGKRTHRFVWFNIITRIVWIRACHFLFTQFLFFSILCLFIITRFKYIWEMCQPWYFHSVWMWWMCDSFDYFWWHMFFSLSWFIELIELQCIGNWMSWLEMWRIVWFVFTTHSSINMYIQI